MRSDGQTQLRVRLSMCVRARVRACVPARARARWVQVMGFALVGLGPQLLQRPSVLGVYWACKRRCVIEPHPPKRSLELACPRQRPHADVFPTAGLARAAVAYAAGVAQDGRADAASAGPAEVLAMALSALATLTLIVVALRTGAHQVSAPRRSPLSTTEYR